MKIIQAGLLVLSGALLSTLFQAQIAHSNVDPLAPYQEELIRLAKLVEIDAQNNVRLKTTGALTVKARSLRLDSQTDVEIKANAIAKFYGTSTIIGKKSYAFPVTQKSVILCPVPGRPCSIAPSGTTVRIGQ